MKHLRHQSRKKEVYESDFGDASGYPGRFLARKGAKDEGESGSRDQLARPSRCKEAPSRLKLAQVAPKLARIGLKLAASWFQAGLSCSLWC